MLDDILFNGYSPGAIFVPSTQDPRSLIQVIHA
ncbi:MAG: hypothetical protein ACI9RY_000581 [Reinekea sp.]|jgi:hypothetical protein